MTAVASCRIRLPDPDATGRLAEWLADRLAPGDTLLLSGPIGAGKSHLSRRLIQTRLARSGRVEEVPSPTFTLVQTYDDGEAEIWHADLYRLTHADEAVELGLADAFVDGICLVEWPDRLGSLAPASALRIALETEPTGQGRLATLSGEAGRWGDIIKGIGTAADGDRRERIGRFLAGSGWAAATRRPLAGDGSARRYERLSGGGGTAILMDADPARGEDVAAFLRVGDWLRGHGYSAPAVLAQEEGDGFLLLEDLGDDLFARLAAADPAAEGPLYLAATAFLADLARQPPPRFLKAGDGPALAGLVGLMPGTWVEHAGGDVDKARELEPAIAELFARLDDGRRAISLRDFHAENLIWLPARSGIARVGLLDFQDAFVTHPAYDLVSLLQDARRDVAREVRLSCLAQYLAEWPGEPEAFRAMYALLGAQRALRILAVFARLCMRDGRAHYLDFAPRVWSGLMLSLDHPDLSALRDLVVATVPAPDTATLARLKEKAGCFPDL